MSKTVTNLFLISVSVAIYFMVISPLYFGGGSLLIIPMEKSIVQLNEFKNKNDKALEDLQKGLDNIKFLKAEYESISLSDQDKINVMIPDNIDPVRLVSEVSKIIITEAGLPVENISYTKANDDKKLPNIGIYTVSFSTKASYEDLKKIIAKLETSRRIFSIQSVNFSSESGSNEPMTVNIKMNTYYIK